MSLSTTVILLALWAGLFSPASARTWTDSTGFYRVEADLIGFNESVAVLKKENHQLVAVPLEKLSQQDQAYLRSKEAIEHARRSADAMQTWTMDSGLKIVGKVVDYARREVRIQGRGGKIYVNDRRFDNLPEVYRKMLPKIVGHFEKTQVDDQRALEAWAMKLRGEPRVLTCEGVLLELENGDQYGVPFFLFSQDDQKILRPGWERWLGGEKDRARQEQERFLLEAQARAYQQDRMISQQMAMMQLQMQGYQAGLFDLWEVRLFPGPGAAGPPLLAVVPARDSRSAAMEAVRRNPGFRAGPVSKVIRK